MTGDEARAVRRRSVGVITDWTVLTGILAVIGVVATVQGLLGRTESQGAAIVAAPVMMWIAMWVWLCAWVVWSYRRQVPALAAAEDPYAESWDVESQATRHASVRLEFVPVATPVGVDLHGLRPTRAARFVNGRWVLVGHAAAIGLCIIAAAIE